MGERRLELLAWLSIAESSWSRRPRAGRCDHRGRSSEGAAIVKKLKPMPLGEVFREEFPMPLGMSRGALAKVCVVLAI